MSSDEAVLFQALDIGPLHVANRIVCPPMVSVRNIVGRDGLAWYDRLAQGGAGTVIVEATAVDRFDAELTVGKMRKLTDAIHRRGAAAAVQLFPVTFGRKCAPGDLSLDEIASIVGQYARAARVCRDAGFDAVEPHGAHGFLINQFFSPQQNARSDGYGKGPENRMRFGLEIVEAIAGAVHDDVRIFYRHTPKGPGYGLADSLAFARRLVDAGVDVLDLSPSSEEAPGDLAAPFKGDLAVPIVTVGEMDRDGRGVEALTEGRADLIAVGRQLIADPYWPSKLRQGRLADIIPCVRCNEKCFGNLRAGKPIACTQWPEGGPTP